VPFYAIVKGIKCHPLHILFFLIGLIRINYCPQKSGKYLKILVLKVDFCFLELPMLGVLILVIISINYSDTSKQKMILEKLLFIEKGKIIPDHEDDFSQLECVTTIM